MIGDALNYNLFYTGYVTYYFNLRKKFQDSNEKTEKKIK